MFLRRPAGDRTRSPWVLVAIGVGMVLSGVIVLAIEAAIGAPRPLGRAVVLVPAGVVFVIAGVVMSIRGKRIDP